MNTDLTVQLLRFPIAQSRDCQLETLIQNGLGVPGHRQFE